MPERPADVDQSILALPSDFDINRLAHHAWHGGSVEWIEYEPGNMTKYRLYRAEIPAPRRSDGNVLIGVTIPHPLAVAHEFLDVNASPDALHIGYVAAKLNLVRHRASPADILPIARATAWLLGRGLAGARDYAGEIYDRLEW